MDILGKRPINWTAIDFPCELWYMCPICKIEWDETLQRSEYNYCIWCDRCQLDIPSWLCCNTKKWIDTFLKNIEYIKKQ